MGLTLYFVNGGVSNGPCKNPFSTSLLRRSSTIWGLEIADRRFRHSLLGISVLLIIVSKPWRRPSHRYFTKLESGCNFNSNSRRSTLTGVETEDGRVAGFVLSSHLPFLMDSSHEWPP